MKTKTPQETTEFHLGQLLKAELARQGPHGHLACQTSALHSRKHLQSLSLAMDFHAVAFRDLQGLGL